MMASWHVSQAVGRSFSTRATVTTKKVDIEDRCNIYYTGQYDELMSDSINSHHIIVAAVHATVIVRGGTFECRQQQQDQLLF